MESEILTFLSNNWQNIVITLIAGLVFYFLSNYALRKYIVSAEKVRLKQAKDSLLDILETRIINKQDISLDKITNLIKALDREHSVYLSYMVSPISLLEDLELRFEKSHHLDPIQKNEYCKQIKNQIQNIKTTEEALAYPKKYSEIMKSLEKEIKAKNTEKALENFELLTKKISERDEHIYVRHVSFADKIVTIVISIIILISIFNFLQIFNIDIVSAILKLVFLLVTIVIISAIIAAFIFGMSKKG